MYKINEETRAYFKALCFQLQSDIEDIPEFVMYEWQELKEEFEQYKKEAIKWSVEDFTTLELEGWEITEEQAKDALEHMIRKHDCNNGITWQDLEYYITVYGKEVEIGTEKWRNNNEN